MHLHLVVAEAKEAAPWREAVSFQDHFDKRGLDNCVNVSGGHIHAGCLYGEQLFKCQELSPEAKMRRSTVRPSWL